MHRATRPPTGSPSSALRAAALIAVLVAGSWAAAPAGPRVRLDLGPTYEFTNLVYHASQPIYVTTLTDSTLNDTTAVFRDSLVIADSPDGELGLLVRVAVGDTAAPERYYYVEPELRLASALVTGHLDGTVRWSGRRGLVVGLDQRLEHSLDQRFGMSRRYDTEFLAGELGLHSTDLNWSLDFRPQLQLDRTNGSLGSYFQDANGDRLELGATHLALSGALLELDSYVGSRAYPDSALRDYREGYAGLRWDQPLPGGLRSMLSGEYERHGGDHPALRHDLFGRGYGSLELVWEAGPWTARGRAEGEIYGYPNPDSVFFDTRLCRAELGAGRSAGPLELELRPRLERLSAPDLPAEDYRQISLLLTATRLAGGFADVSVEAGRRHYLAREEQLASGSEDVQPTHSDFHVYSVSVVLSQPLGRRVALKGSLDYLAEVHDNPAENNHIVFLSTELVGSLGWGGPRPRP
ncbi:MAG TPA: hypothetical protein VMS93_08720 [Candidatus Saccharimonadales bacterium]|nr:hypothetical protein [Candidatus Saccharimonadales bacterium]